MHPHTTNPMSGVFLRELDRFIATSGFGVEAVAELAELPVAALTGAYGGAIRVPAQKVRQLAENTGADDLALMRIWFAEYAPWVLLLLDDLCPCARANAESGAVA